MSAVQAVVPAIMAICLCPQAGHTCITDLALGGVCMCVMCVFGGVSLAVITKHSLSSSGVGEIRLVGYGAGAMGLLNSYLPCRGRCT